MRIAYKHRYDWNMEQNLDFLILLARILKQNKNKRIEKIYKKIKDEMNTT